MAQRFQKTAHIPCCLNDSDSARVTLFGQSSLEQLKNIPALLGICTMSISSGCADMSLRLTGAKARELAALLIAAADSLQAEGEVL